MFSVKIKHARHEGDTKEYHFAVVTGKVDDKPRSILIYCWGAVGKTGDASTEIVTEGAPKSTLRFNAKVTSKLKRGYKVVAQDDLINQDADEVARVLGEKIYRHPKVYSTLKNFMDDIAASSEGADIDDGPSSWAKTMRGNSEMQEREREEAQERERELAESNPNWGAF